MAQRTRKPLLYTFNCTGCGYCVKVCGNEVLKLVDNGSCRFVNVADASRCTGCGRCQRRCPHGAISLRPENTMKKKLKAVGAVLGRGASLTSGGAVVMWLWNASVPAATGRGSIGYWQALGLMLLAWLLFRHSRPAMTCRE